jgi:hypothetical protein
MRHPISGRTTQSRMVFLLLPSGYSTDELWLSQTNMDINHRQITITGHGKTKPALIITNDFDLPAQLVVRRSMVGGKSHQ